MRSEGLIGTVRKEGSNGLGFRITANIYPHLKIL